MEPVNAIAMTARIAATRTSVGAMAGSALSLAAGPRVAAAGKSVPENALKTLANDRRVQKLSKKGNKICRKIMESANGAKLVPVIRASIPKFLSCRSRSDICRVLEKMRQDLHMWLDQSWNDEISSMLVVGSQRAIGLAPNEDRSGNIQQDPSEQNQEEEGRFVSQRAPPEENEEKAPMLEQQANMAGEGEENLSFAENIIKKFTTIWQGLCLLVEKLVKLFGKILKVVYDTIIWCWEGIKTCAKKMYSAVAEGMQWFVSNVSCWFGN